jgi:hypothetical protein
LAAAPAPTGSFSPFPNFVDPDNLAGDLSNRRSNPIQRPSHLCDDDAVPAIFDLSNHSGVRKVKSVLGTHAAFEIETLGCSLSWLFDHAAAATEILEAVQRLPPSGPNNTVSPEHSGLVSRLEKLSSGLKAILDIIADRFSLLTASAASPNNRNLLNALTARVRSNTAFEDQIPSARVRLAVLDLESQRCCCSLQGRSPV